MSFLKFGQVELFTRAYSPGFSRHVPWSPTAWRMFGSSPSPVNFHVSRSQTRLVKSQSPSRHKAHALAPESDLRSFASPRTHVGQKTAVRIRLNSRRHAHGVAKQGGEEEDGSDPWVDCWNVWRARTVAKYKGSTPTCHQVRCVPAVPGGASDANCDSKFGVAALACVEANWDSVHRRLLSEKSQYPLEFEEEDGEDGADPWVECWKVWLARVAVRCKSRGANEAKSKADAKLTFAASACVKNDWDNMHRRLLSEKSQCNLELEEEDGADPWLECWKVWLARVAVRCKSRGASEAKSKVGAKSTFALATCVEANWDDAHRRLLSEKARYHYEDGVDP